VTAFYTFRAGSATGENREGCTSELPETREGMMAHGRRLAFAGRTTAVKRRRRADRASGALRSH